MVIRHNKIFKKEILQMDGLLNWQDDKKQSYIKKQCICKVARNVSSIELEKLLDPNSLAICSKKEYKYKGSEDCLQPCPQILQYSRIVMQTCQNKGCMCKPVIQRVPKCQVTGQIQADFDNEEHPTVTTKNAKNQTPNGNDVETIQSKTPHQRKISRSETSEPKTSPSPSDISEENKSNTISQNETFDYSKAHIQSSEGPRRSKTRQSQTVDVLEHRNSKRGSIKSKNYETNKEPIRYEMCKKNACDPCPDQMRYCVPSNFDQLLQENGNREMEFMHCKNRDLCTCDTYDTTESLRKGLKLPGKYICIQSPAEPEYVENMSVKKESLLVEEHPKEEEQESKQEEKTLPLKTEEKKQEKPMKASSSTSGTCFCFSKKPTKKDSEKCVQTCKCCSDKTCQVEESFTSCVYPSIVPCPIPEPTCERVKSIWICSKCGKISNTSNTCRNRHSCMRNTIVLPQTSGQVFCTDQADALRTMIKLEAKQNFRQIDNILQELYQQRNEIKKLSDMYQSIVGTRSRNSGINNEYFDNGGLQNTQIYICEGCELDVNRNILRTITARGNMNQNFDEDEKEWETSYQTVPNNKYIKNIINKKRSSPTTPGQEIQIKNVRRGIQNDTKHNLPFKHDATELKGKRQTTKTDDDDDHDARTQSENLDHVMMDEIETEKPHECSFVNWWKKSLTNLKQNKSKDILKRKYRSLRKKISECKRSLTDSNKAQSEDKLGYSQYIKDKINQCKTSLTNFKKTQDKDPVNCNYQYLQQKINDCKELHTNLKERYDKNAEKCNLNEFLKNKTTLCKVKENKEKKSIMNFCK